MPQVPELDYMSYIVFEVYERSKDDGQELAVRISLSEGAHSAVLDASLDAKHALQVQPRRALTGTPFSVVVVALVSLTKSPLCRLHQPRPRDRSPQPPQADRGGQAPQEEHNQDRGSPRVLAPDRG